MKAFKCDICGQYYDQYYETDIKIIPEQLSPITKSPRVHAYSSSIINIETFDLHDPIQWDLCKECRSMLDDIVIRYIKEKRMENKP